MIANQTPGLWCASQDCKHLSYPGSMDIVYNAGVKRCLKIVRQNKYLWILPHLKSQDFRILGFGISFKNSNS
jgi:hypothetical protein